MSAYELARSNLIPSLRIIKNICNKTVQWQSPI